MASTNHRPFRCSFRSWMAQQQQDLDELAAANSSPAAAEEDLARLRDKCVAHFAEYAERRAAMAGQNPPCFLSPPWCSAFENAFMWVGGCRPSLFIRLTYHACGSELDAFLRGERKGNLAELTARQLEMINALHCKTVKEEDKFDTRIASLQV